MKRIKMELHTYVHKVVCLVSTYVLVCTFEYHIMYILHTYVRTFFTFRLELDHQEYIRRKNKQKEEYRQALAEQVFFLCILL